MTAYYYNDNGRKKRLKGCLVYRCDECTNCTGEKGMVYNDITEARKVFGCTHTLRGQRQYERTHGDIFWVDVKHRKKQKPKENFFEEWEKVIKRVMI